MRLWLARRHWNLFARTDAYWAVLTQPDKQGNRWQIDEFFRTGRANVSAQLEHLQRVLPDWRPHGQALDFGCGVGRLTQALADHFDRVTGVDISVDMLKLAREHNRAPDRVEYLENRDADLRQFPDRRFAMVLSLITLQHIAPEYGRRYLAEFARVCAPGGVIIVQVPAQDHVSQPRRFSWWLPTHWKRWKRAARRWLVMEPTMEMHTIPREEVQAILEQGGLHVVHVDTLPVTGPGYTSFRYIAHRPLS